MKRSEILEAARRCVCGEREQDYGTPENNFETIGLLWGVYLRAAHPEYAKVMPINGITAKDAGTTRSWSAWLTVCMCPPSSWTHRRLLSLRSSAAMTATV